MSKNKDFSGLTAMVTGASSGIGKEMALYLASLGADLILVARNQEKLDQTAQIAEEKFQVKSETISMDLSKEKSAQKLYNLVKEKGLKVDILVNNSGFGVYGFFDGTPLERHSDMLHLNIQTLTELTSLFLEDMKKNNLGYILLTASTAAFQPTPLYSTYGASKAYVLNFGTALHYELKVQKLNIHCSILCPGPTDTSFFKSANHPQHDSSTKRPGILLDLFMMKPDKVAKIGIRAMLKNKPVVVSGFGNKLMVIATKFLPKAWVNPITYRVMKNKT